MPNNLRREVAALSASLAKAQAALTQVTQPTQGRFTAKRAGLPAHRETLFGPATAAPFSKRLPAATLGSSNTLFKGYPEYDPNQPRGKGGQWGGGATGYREGGTFTHAGKQYDLDKVLAAVDNVQTKKAKVADLAWVLRYDKPDPKRVAAADTTKPVIATMWSGKPVVIDGLHRLARARELGRASIPVKFIADIEFARVGSVTKGYPEFNENQARGKDGRFVEGGGSSGGKPQGEEQPSGWRRAGRIAAQTAGVVALAPFTFPLMGLALRPAARAIYARRMAAERARRNAYRRLIRESQERAAREAAAAREARSLWRRGGLGRRFKDFLHGDQTGAMRTAEAISRAQRAAGSKTIDKLPKKWQDRIRRATRRGSGDPVDVFAPWLGP